MWNRTLNSHHHTTTTTVPGRRTCPEGYNRQYYGWLSSNFFSHSGSSDWICVDNTPEAISTSSGGNENGALLYPTEVEGPPTFGVASGYVQDREVTCAVCTLPGTARSIYVQWGKRLCSNATTVYTGWMGGGHLSHKGSGSDYLCMANVPEYVYGFTDGDNVRNACRASTLISFSLPREDLPSILSTLNCCLPPPYRTAPSSTRLSTSLAATASRA